MKIYTKKGDKGQTSLVGGTRIPKNHIRIETTGTIDELIAHIGMLRSYPETTTIQPTLTNIQDVLMQCCTIVSSDETVQQRKIHPNQVALLEQRIDEAETKLPPLEGFILPGGIPSVAHCHIARTVCRRAERQCVKASKDIQLAPEVITYLNRLSDYLFVISRQLACELNVDEFLWEPVFG